MLGGEACFNELDPSSNPVLFLDDEDYTLKLQSDTLHNESLFEILDTASNNGGEGGIEATDVSSLLAQFEEAADSAKDIQKMFDVKTETPAPEIADPASIKLSDDVIRKIRALKEKKKSTIMLPMGMPSKRGRGSAIAMHSSSASQKLQKIMASNLNENSVIKLDTYTPRKPSLSNAEKTTDVCANYYTPIPEHDYCQNVPKSEKETNVSIDYNEDDILDLQDTETWSDKENDENDSGINESYVSNSSAKKQQNNKRNYRKRDREESPEIESGNYFDKIPSYYTALSRKHSQKKSKTSGSDKPLGNSSFEDTLQSNNPTPHMDSSAYSKLPAYYSCFTNSTKYDVDNSKGFDSSQDSRSSGYSSIPSSYRSRSPSPSYERSPSRSRSRYNSVSRGRRRTRVDRRSSYSSADSRSSSRSSSKCSMCSRTRSVSRTRCISRDSYSSDSSYSRSRSRSPNYRRTSRSRSREKRRQRRQKEREERKQQQIEERRIIYVGKVPNDYTRKKLHTRFQRFGEIEEVSLHFREHGDNYGFVTFLYTCDAYAAIEKGNTIPGEERFDLCFGGRRQFCETEYADLDGNAEMEEEFNPYPTSSDPFDFDALLKQAKNKMSKR
ncbi:uncharacterized protein LOC143071098 isoform X3 [Mytilus galloprovincialis]